jgi:hypothetical protein
MTNWIHPAHVAVSIQKDLSSDSATKEKMERIIELWQNADNSRNDPKALLTFFGEGLSVYITLPERLKESLWVYVSAALGEAASVANHNRIRVTFDVAGPVFD